jgi:hypothetical protein
MLPHHIQLSSHFLQKWWVRQNFIKGKFCLMLIKKLHGGVHRHEYLYFIATSHLTWIASSTNVMCCLKFLQREFLSWCSSRNHGEIYRYGYPCHVSTLHSTVIVLSTEIIKRDFLHNVGIFIPCCHIIVTLDYIFCENYALVEILLRGAFVSVFIKEFCGEACRIECPYDVDTTHSAVIISLWPVRLYSGK